MEIKAPDVPSGLSRIDAALGPKLSLREVELSELAFAGIKAPNVTAELCRFERVNLVGCLLAGLRLWNTRIERGDWSGVQAEEGHFDRVEFRSVRMRGFVGGAAGFRNVAFIECQLDSASFRFTNLANVRFENCSMKEADFSSSTLEYVEFNACDLAGATFERATMKDVDLRTSSVGELRSADGLAGATISTLQLLDMAQLLAASLRLRVNDE